MVRPHRSQRRGAFGSAAVGVLGCLLALLVATCPPVSSPGAHAAPGFLVPSLAGGVATVGHDHSSNRPGSAPAASVRGASSGVNIDSYRWANATYAVGPIAPGYRFETQMAWDAADNYSILFGGESAKGVDESDTWTYLNGSWTNITSEVTGHPPPTLDGSMAYDPSTRSVILFGGTAAGAWRNYTWSYHDRTWTNLSATAHAPPITIQPTLATDANADELVTAFVDFYSIAETWTFQGGHWTNVTATAHFPLQVDLGYSDPVQLCADPADGGVLALSVLANGTGFWGGTYVFKSGSWLNLTSESPTAPILPYGIIPYSGEPLFYLPSAAAVVYHAGFYMTQNSTIPQTSVTWAFVADRWSNVTAAVGPVPAPSVLSAGGVAVDPVDSAAVTFGGTCTFLPLTQQWLPTWTLSAPPIPHASATPGVTDVGTSVSFRGNSSAGLEPNVAEWSFGDGSNSSSFATAHSYAAAGVYGASLTVTDLVGQSGSGSTTVVVNALPSVSVAASASSASLGSNVSFLASVSGGTAPFSYSWTLGDGATSSSALATHAYASSGSYTVKVTITDSVGKSANASGSITVTAVPSSSSPTPSAPPVSLTSGLGLDLLLGVVVLLIVVAALALLLLRRGGGGSPPGGSGPSTAGETASGPPPPPPGASR
jgi:PKD repeat protein